MRIITRWQARVGAGTRALWLAGWLGFSVLAQAQGISELLPPDPAPTPAPNGRSAGRAGGGPANRGAAATSAPTTSAAKSDDPPQKGDPLSSDQLKALVIVEGDYSAGSGFVAKIHDQFFIVTNLHVLSGNKKFTMTGMDGTKYPTTGPLFGAVGFDVAILKIPANLAKYYLEIQDDPVVGTKADDAVTVPGNSGGAGVPVQIHGKLIGVGPQLVEVDAKFVPGNSGSPIIHRDSGKVIGMATFTLTHDLDDLKNNANISQIRWFGYRLDNIKQWESLDWPRFSEEGVKLREVENLSDFLIAILSDKKLPPIDNKQVESAIISLQTKASQAKAQNNRPEYLAAIHEFVRVLHSIADNDIQQVTGEKLSAYHAAKLKEQQDLRVKIDEVLLDINKE